MIRLHLLCFALFAAEVLAQNCPNQAIGPGTYTIKSALEGGDDDRCVITDPDKPSATFYPCTGTPGYLKNFTFMADPAHGGCYRLGTVINGVYRYLLPTISPDLPGALLVVAQPGATNSMYWQVQKNSDNTYTFVAVGIPSNPCMNRRTDDGKGRVQAIHCTGISSLERFILATAD
jgi:hypothetical protein